MEAVPVPYAPEQSISPYRQIRNPKRNNRRFISKPSENLSPSKSVREGLLLGPPPFLFSSFRSSPLLFDHHHLLQPQPPLLPLPAPKTYASLPPRSPPINKKNRSPSATPKKSKASSSSPKQEVSRSTAMSDGGPVMASSTNRIGPDPKDLPKEAVSRILTSGNMVTAGLDTFSGTVFTLSPPPSSLPLPKFSLRPKLGCNAEASGIDAGATDNLRRLLRLR